ncbi:hypothetical protein TUSST3_40640 [Streptomyces sp. TUS-ST3]|uniref:hypothetical protein n=1 Tax=Streptomyces sp. TUS-ST3 TaxID=3025591 RepID=UPI00235B477E|nr:hypothetical protein [Streptomyces sp. TUS-ST3]GLP67442.1 hypothetical protein TUSST3_40640 [Streptomyces sp. TUS-ST3]
MPVRFAAADDVRARGVAAHVRQRLLHHAVAGRSTCRAARRSSIGSARRPMPAAQDRSGGRGQARASGGIIDGMQVLAVVQLALAALARLCLVLCALVTVEAAR